MKCSIYGLIITINAERVGFTEEKVVSSLGQNGKLDDMKNHSRCYIIDEL